MGRKGLSKHDSTDSDDSIHVYLFIFHSYSRCTKNKRLTPEEKDTVVDLDKNMLKRKAQLHEIEQGLPQKNSLYLKIILGDVNVSILNRSDKVRYKDDYEKFKLILNVIGLFLSFLNIVVNYR